MKKYLALLLALMLTLSCLTGCDTLKPSSSGDDAVMEYNGYEVTWDQFMYYLYYASHTLTSYYQNSTGGGVDWDGVCMYDRNITNAEWCVNEALYMAAEGMTILSKSKELNCEVTDEQMDQFEEQIESLRESFASADDPEKEFEDTLRAQGYTEDSLKRNGKINAAFTNVFKALYGENGETLDDESFNKFIADSGYLKSTHILFLFTKTVEKEDGTTAQETISDDEKAQKKEQAEELVAELQAISDDKERYDRFIELVNELSEDTGKVRYAEGYVFTEGTMVQEFTDTTKALKPYEVSGVVESTYGYHIIMGLPIERTDVETQSQTGYSLGYTAASYALDDEMKSWNINSVAEFNSAYKSFDFTQFFGDDGFAFTTFAEYTAAKAE